MARKEKETKRKRKSIPKDVYLFIGTIEALLEIDISSKKQENGHDSQSSHSRQETQNSKTRANAITNSNANMLEQETPIDTAPSMGLLPAMELISEGLENVDSATLRKTLDPIWKSLESLDAIAMLNLIQTENGAQVADGVCVKPIHDEVTPIRHRKGSTVRYVHVSEVPDKYSVGIFIFPPNARIPLHDHPGMCVLSRVLYGDLERTSLDLLRDEQSQQQQGSSWLPWRKLPPGSRRAYLNGLDHLQAPAVTALYPYEGQLHEFRAGPNGAAVLDVLLPPYDEDHDRDCTFYNIQRDESSLSKNNGPCWIVPTGQPDDFHCLSGRYNGLGGDYFDSDDSEH